MKIEELAENIKREYSNWLYIREHGTQDPFWPDGVNMNLIRNHIIYDKKQIEKILENETPLFMPEIDIPTPPEVDPDFMAVDPAKTRPHVRPINEARGFVYEKPTI